MDYAALRTRQVAPIITKYGTAITLRQFADSFVAATGKNTRTATETSAHGVIQEYKQGTIDGTMVKQGDVMLISADLAAEPKQGDQVDIASVVWQVVSVTSVKPGGVIVLYTLQLRK